jgi:alpha-L-fucosidase 2
LTNVVIKSLLGGNLRLRLPNVLKIVGKDVLRKAQGANTNRFYQTIDTPEPIISAAAIITPVKLKETFLYDIDTKPGGIYTLVAE